MSKTEQFETGRNAKLQKEAEKLRSIKPDVATRFKLSVNSDIGDYGKVIVVGPTGTPARAFTICRPLGVHKLPEKTWIFGDESDIHLALARLKDPGQERIDEEILKKEKEILKAAKLITAEGMMNHANLTGQYENWLDNAKARMSAENAKNRALHDAKFKDAKGQKPKFRPVQDISKFLNKEESSFWVMRSKAFDDGDLKTQVESIPRTFETTLGVNRRVQKAIELGLEFRPEDNVLSSVLDKVQETIYDVFVNGTTAKTHVIQEKRDTLDELSKRVSSQNETIKRLIKEKAEAIQKYVEIQKELEDLEKDNGGNKHTEDEYQLLHADYEIKDADFKYAYEWVEKALKDDEVAWKTFKKGLPSSALDNAEDESDN